MIADMYAAYTLARNYWAELAGANDDQLNDLYQQSQDTIDAIRTAELQLLTTLLEAR